MDLTEEEKEQIKKKVEKLMSSKFKQQMLPAWRPIPSFRMTLAIFIFFGLVFVGLGVAIFVSTQAILEIIIPYNNGDDACKEINKKCNITFTVTEQMNGPVYVFYQIEGFYQNHRSYVKSKSFDQLTGTYLEIPSLTSDCEPILKVSDIGENIRSVSGKLLNGSWPAIPCGLIARSFFNDNYTLYLRDYNNTAKKVSINQQNIAWSNDKTYKFKNIQNPPLNKTWQDVQWLDMENEHFIVWMRLAGLPNFRKTWGKIDDGLIPGEYIMNIDNKYDMSEYKGKKNLVLSTTNYLGGKNYFLAICYLTVGVMCMIFAFSFTIAKLNKNSRDKQRKKEYQALQKKQREEFD